MNEDNDERAARQYQRYIERTKDDMKIACQIFPPSSVAETHMALGIDLLLNLGGVKYAQEILANLSAGLKAAESSSREH